MPQKKIFNLTSLSPVALPVDHHAQHHHRSEQLVGNFKMMGHETGVILFGVVDATKASYQGWHHSTKRAK